MRNILLAASLGVFAACNSGTNTSSPNTAEVSFVLTDAASDELTQFEVDVCNIVMTKLNGNTVSVMPRATRVDFMELESLGELIAGVTAEAGVYRAISLDFDFSNARVVIGDQTNPATVNDKDGNAITGVQSVSIEFAAGSRPSIGLLRHNMFVLDLDLNQSVTVDAATNTVTFTPVLSAELDPSNPKPTATKGILKSVSFDTRTFEVERRAIDNSVIGTFTVKTNDLTVFQLSGTVGVGAVALGSLPSHIGQCIYVQGAMLGTSENLQAVAVETGNGVPGNGQDWVVGHVVGRTGGTGSDAILLVRGRSVDVSTGTRRYNTLHTVDVSFASTKVLRRGAGNSLDTDAINIGQLVWVFGELTSATLDATSSAGVARLLQTSIFGIAAGPASGSTVTVDLVRFGLRDESAFNFTVAGQSQADPDAYTVDVGNLSTAGITTGSKLRLLGWIKSVNATGDDAQAISITNRSTTARLLFCQWSPPRTTAIDQNSAADTIGLDVSTAIIKAVGDGFGTIALNTSPAPSIKKLLNIGFYRIVQNGAIEANLSFEAFRTSLLQRSATAAVFRVGAFGTFDESTQTFSALTMTVILD